MSIGKRKLGNQYGQLINSTEIEHGNRAWKKEISMENSKVPVLGPHYLPFEMILLVCFLT